MPANKIIDVKSIKTIMKGGRRFSVEYATKTDAWNRIHLAEAVKTGFVKAVENAEVSANATKAVLAEKEHPSMSDSKDHFTTAFQDANGNHIATRHLYPVT
ncbi:hypothetical protein AUEXF2481DRAFT_91462 [Aureobasidium subglaciale EXF-2481]|uniref:Uncharacterized protein n=1 Tax=Aureobasidium subglaciale (strain EXF-2481) TaxID=1043005 RepID=A0A074YZ82_AURSE|nr:uncharacterized protein AUEXF2481DRAFT_91462 [Aureobasidium subglaciale EXF-2481]KEQ92126.1 hypothetical protein AUEXF2481DRAFT_91462 [Aureobasidium subglaciale EXF-2481]